MHEVPRHDPGRAAPRLAALPARGVAVAAALLAAQAGVGWGSPASAAVRVCKAPVSSGLVSDTTEIAARRGAIAAWTAKARAAGVENPAWRIAGNKILRCARVTSGRFDCLAVGAPCSIAQVAPAPAPSRPTVPGVPPPGAKPRSKQPSTAPISI